MEVSTQRKIFDNWIVEYRALLFKVIRSYTIHQADQDDLFQDICLQLYRSIPNFQKKSADSTWIYRIALNTAITWSTKSKKHVKDHHELDHNVQVLDAQDSTLDERMTWLYDQIHQLDEVDRSISLLLLEGFSYKEMGNMLGISESNIGVKIHRIKKHLVSNAKHYEHGN